MIIRRQKDHQAAYFMVHSLALASAAFLFVFQWSAASLLRGSSGLGSDMRLWMESKTDLT